MTGGQDTQQRAELLRRAQRARSQAQEVQAWTFRVAAALTATGEQVAATADRLIQRGPRHAERLRSLGESARAQAAHNRRWVNDHTRTGASAPANVHAWADQAPEIRLIRAEARLAELRKDKATLPAGTSLSPAPSTASQVVAIRNLIQMLRREDLAGLAWAAAQQAHRGQELLDRIAHSLLQAGLNLQAATGLASDAAAERITQALQRLDDTIREIRDRMFAAHAAGPRLASSSETVRRPGRSRQMPARAQLPPSNANRLYPAGRGGATGDLPPPDP